MMLENNEDVHTATYWLCLSFPAYEMEIILYLRVVVRVKYWASVKYANECVK